MRTCYSLFSGCGGSDTGIIQAGFTAIGGIEYHKPAAAIYNANHNCPVTVADVLEIDSIPTVDLLWASPPCFPAGVTVLTDKGLKNIEDISIGDLVVTHKGRLKPVTNTMSRNSDTIMLEGLGHWGLATTKDHPFLTSKIKTTYPSYKERCKGNYSTQQMIDPYWENAVNMVNNHWLSLVNYPFIDIPSIEFKGNESIRGQVFDVNSPFFWWIVGCWIGDGWIRYSEGSCKSKNRGVVYICTDKNDNKKLEEVLIASGIKYGKSEERTTIRFSICSRPLCRWLSDNFSTGAKGKQIPLWLLGASYEIRKSFLDGYIAADGHCYHPNSYLKPVISCSTVSKNLAIAIRMLGISLGYSASLKCYERTRNKVEIEGRLINESPNYVIRLSSSQRHSRLIDNEIIYRSGCVRKISECKSNDVVYDITVADDESFIADGIIVHNCPSFSVINHCDRGEKESDIKLATHIADLMTCSRPRMIAIENVRGYSESESLEIILSRLESVGYKISVSIECAANYGAPTTRERLIVRASLDKLYPVIQTHQRRSNQLSLFPLPNWISWWEVVADRIEELPRSELIPLQCKYLEAINFDLPAISGLRLLIQRGCIYDFRPVIRDRDEPAPTIRAAQGEGVGFNILAGTDCYAADNLCLAAWQGFPSNYKWIGSKTAVGRAIGNAVPPPLAKAIALSLK